MEKKGKSSLKAKIGAHWLVFLFLNPYEAESDTTEYNVQRRAFNDAFRRLCHFVSRDFILLFMCSLTLMANSLVDKSMSSFDKVEISRFICPFGRQLFLTTLISLCLHVCKTECHCRSVFPFFDLWTVMNGWLCAHHRLAVQHGASTVCRATHFGVWCEECKGSMPLSWTGRHAL